MTGLRVLDGVVRLDWELLGDLLGTPYDAVVDGEEIEITMRHVTAIVSGHGPVGAYIRGVTAALRNLPHAVSACACGHRITVAFDLPVAVD